MATRYCGPGGNDGNSGLTWILRKLTLNGVEDTPVVAGDLCWIAPGVYRELLTVDVGGAAVAGNIVYVGDVTGEHTDGVGGVVRITGSDNDQTEVRANCITANGRDYRTFRGFTFDTTTSYLLNLIGSPTDWIVEDCPFVRGGGVPDVYVDGATQADMTFRRCSFLTSIPGYALDFNSAGTQDTGHLIQNCLFYGGGKGVELDDVGGVTFRNCRFVGQNQAIRITDSPPVGFTAVVVENCIFAWCDDALVGRVLGEIVEDFNTFYRNQTDRTIVNVGANSETYPPLYAQPLLHAGAGQVSGFKIPWQFGELSEWSQVRAITGSNEPGVDFYGIPRPVTASKNSWGPMQFVDMELESGTVQAGTYSRVLHDAGQVLVRRIPVTGVEITVTLYVRREANYAGNLPQMVIKQPGQADQVTVSVAAVNTWEQLSDTFTPASPPGFVEVWTESRNTAVAGNFNCYYDTMGIS